VEQEEDEFSAPAPRFSAQRAEVIARERFGISGVASPLDSERDQNFRIKPAEGESFVLKIANHAEDHSITDLQVQALLHIAVRDSELSVPSVLRTPEGEALTEVEGPDGQTHAVRMVSYLAGAPREPWDVDAPSLAAIGRYSARLSRALSDFSHPAASRPLVWDIQRLGDLTEHIDDLADDDQKARAAAFLERFTQQTLPALGELRQQIVHNDLHAENAVMAADGSPTVNGIIDFGDLVMAPLVCDLGVTVASFMYGRGDAFEAAGVLCAAYHEETPLTEAEIAVLPELVASRALGTALIGAWRARENPENRDYLLEWDGPAWALLDQFDSLGMDEVHRRFRAMF